MPMPPFRFALRQTLAALSLAALAAAAPGGAEAQAPDGKANARYDVTLAGIEIGKAALVVDIDNGAYTSAASARVSGLAQIVSDGKGSAGARGSIVRERLQPSSFALTASGDDKLIEVRFGVERGAAKDVVVSPPPQPRPDRVALTDSHRRGVLDPMSAILMPVAGDPMSPAACARTLPIFDGATRYDLTFAYERNEAVKTKGFQGDSVVCRVAFKAIAGHREGRKEIEYMEANRDIFVWLVPVAGTRVLVPFRIQVATRIGTVVIQARVFTTEARIARTSAPAPAGSVTR